MGKKRFYSALISCCCWLTHLSGQSAFSDDLYVQAAYHPGFVMPEYSLFNYLLNDYAQAFTLSLSKQTPGENYWAQLYNYPEYGIAVQFSTLGNADVFGEEWSFYPFFQIHIIDKGKFSLLNKTGLGIGLVNKQFDSEQNPSNVAVGTSANLHFNFELNAQYQVAKRFFLYTGIALDHLSNGNLGEPNLGINTTTFNAGLRYRVGALQERNSFETEKHVSSNRVSLILAAGAKHARSLQSKSYLISSLSLELKRKLTRVFYPGIGLDVLYDASTQEEIRAFGTEPYHPIDDFKSGFHFTQELVYNKFSLSLQEGFYLVLQDKAFGHATYHRFIIRHQVSDRLFVQLAMKAHVVVLDYLEFGCGYHLKP